MNQMKLDLNHGWKFHYGDVKEAWYKGYDDSAWEDVTLPHDWSVHMPFSKEYSSGTGYLAGGIGWYRVHFSLPEEYRGKCVRVVFDGIYKNSCIFCNSYHLGKWPYGYSEISYDISDMVQFGDVENEISVQVTRLDLADSRWFTGSGIYRKAWILVEEPVHAALHGVTLETKGVAGDEAFVCIKADVVNTTEEPWAGVVRFDLRQEDGRIAASFETKISIPEEEEVSVSLDGVVSGAKLWSLESPYLYTLETSLVGPETDYITEVDRVGIRTIAFEPDKGFFLNGISTKLKGVCVHHDGGCLGAAMYREVWLRRLLRLKEMGCNSIRTSHNPHMPELYDLCDELGFLMMDEAFDEWENPKNKWSTGHNVYPPKHDGYAEDFPVWYEKDLKTMILRDRNHPSIVMWSVGNEIDYPNDPYCHPLFTTMTGNNDANKPAKERQYDHNKPNAERLVRIEKKLVNVVKKTDSTRPVTLAAAFPELSAELGFLAPLDVVGYNYKEHLYEKDHERFPDKSFLGSENGHGYGAWKAVVDNDYISGQFLWTGIDYLGEAHGWPYRASGAGVLDLAGQKKPGFYRRKAFWSEVPYACLLTGVDDGREVEWRPLDTLWNYKEAEMIVVRCFTNQSQAELFLNGRSLGVETAMKPYGCFEWKLPYAPGILSVSCGEATAQLETVGEGVAFTTHVWNGEKALEEQQLSAKFAGTQEVYQIEVELVDDLGRFSGLKDVSIQAIVENGTLLGLENGSISDLTSYAENYRMTHHGRLTVFIKPDINKQPKVKLFCEELQQTVEILSFI